MQETLTGSEANEEFSYVDFYFKKYDIDIAINMLYVLEILVSIQIKRSCISIAFLILFCVKMC